MFKQFHRVLEVEEPLVFAAPEHYCTLSVLVKDQKVAFLALEDADLERVFDLFELASLDFELPHCVKVFPLHGPGVLHHAQRLKLGPNLLKEIILIFLPRLPNGAYYVISLFILVHVVHGL